MVYYKIPLSGGLDYPAGCILICAYTYNGYEYCKFERVTEVGSGWVSITEAEFNVRCPEFPEPEYAGVVESTEHPGCFYRMIDGEKEWVNPPMELNKHYRTIERFRGKPVYVAQIFLGYGVPSSESLVGTDILAIRASGYLVGERYGEQVLLPYKDQVEDISLHVKERYDPGGSEMYVSVYSPQNSPGWECYAQVWYIKK